MRVLPIAYGHPIVLDAGARTIERTRNRTRVLPIVAGPHCVQVFHTQGKIFRDDNHIYKKELLKVLHDLAFLPLCERSLHPPMMLLVGRLLPWSDDHDEAAAPTRPDFHNCAPPTWHAKDVGGNDTYGITRIPSTFGGCRVVQRAGLVASTKIVYPGSGRKDA